MTKEAFESLMSSIRENEQHEPITINNKGEVLDGHNRLRVCEKLKLEPLFEVKEFENPSQCIINSFQLNSETCVRIKQIVKQEIESIVSNPRKLLSLALASLFESSRKHPGKFQTLYYNMPSHLSVEQILSESSINQNASPYRYSVNKDEKILLDEAEQSYNRIIDAITNNCINGMQNETEPLYHSPQVLEVNDGLSSVAGNHKIFDTRSLSQINFVYNNVTFQVCSNSKTTDEKNTYDEMVD